MVRIQDNRKAEISRRRGAGVDKKGRQDEEKLIAEGEILPSKG
jgi:hypothetical protein